MFLVVVFHYSLESSCTLNNVMKSRNPHVSLFIRRCTKRKLPLNSYKIKWKQPVFRKAYFDHIGVGFETIDNWSKRYYFEFFIGFLNRSSWLIHIMLNINLSCLKINFKVSFRKWVHKHTCFHKFLQPSFHLVFLKVRILSFESMK